MSHVARCKFVCTQVNSDNVTLDARYDDTVPEDQAFSQFTPWGQLTFGLTNPALKGFFEVGQAYYLDIAKA